ncbi:lysophospholipid acyltransferase 6-like [Dysidea avara]|uniref:lysophospholipid acyltransferase 6-like n=1 Tax=Dysidea avara TaxID=196820 RepID=UPI00332D3C7A
MYFVDAIVYPFKQLDNLLFLPTAEISGLHEGEVRYMFLLFCSIFLGFVMKHVLHPSRVTITTRHCYSSFVGLVFGLMCFGFVEMIYLLIVIGSCYTLLLVISPNVVQKYTMIWMLVCVSAAHVYRMITAYGDYKVDFTGPLMIIVQRTTYVAFALHDGMAHQPSSLNEDQQRHQLKQRPTSLEYLSYNFCFLSFLAGPACPYKDYDDFITGANFTSAKLSKLNQSAMVKDRVEEPSNLDAVLRKTVTAIIFAIIYLVSGHFFPVDMVLAPDVNPMKRLILLYIVTFGIRGRYYFGWLIVDSVCNSAGLGFNGYNKLGYAQWDLVTGMDIWAFEFGTSLRTVINGWNVMTTHWLRRVCYERVKFMDPTLASFILSAWWHGFYPAFYLMFVTLALNLMAARKMRRLLHHHFQSPPIVKQIYDVLTWFIAIMSTDIASFSIMILTLEGTLQHFGYYYYINVIVPLVIIVLPIGKKSRRELQQKNVSANVKEEQTEVASKDN